MRSILPSSGLLCVLLVGALVACTPSRGTIGAYLGGPKDSGRLFIRAVPKGLAADQAGLKPGDELLLIDGVDVRSLTDRELHAALTGPVDSEVKLTLVRGDQVIRVTLRRTEAQRYSIEQDAELTPQP